MEARGFAFTRLTTGLPFSQRFSKEDAPTTNIIIRFSGISRQHISESQCLGAELPLLTELPRRVLLGNWASGVRGSRKFAKGGSTPALSLRLAESWSSTLRDDAPPSRCPPPVGGSP